MVVSLCTCFCCVQIHKIGEVGDSGKSFVQELTSLVYSQYFGRFCFLEELKENVCIQQRALQKKKKTQKKMKK